MLKLIKLKVFSDNKKIECKKLIKKVENCKPFIGISMLFLLISLIFDGEIIHFYLKFKKNVLPY